MTREEAIKRAHESLINVVGALDGGCEPDDLDKQRIRDAYQILSTARDDMRREDFNRRTREMNAELPADQVAVLKLKGMIS